LGRLAICAYRRWVRFWGESLGIDSRRGRFLGFRLVRFRGGVGTFLVALAIPKYCRNLEV